MDLADEQLHKTLVRQLRRLGMDAEQPPTSPAWGQLLARISRAYADADAERHLLEHALDVSSREMRSLHSALAHQAHRDMLTGLPNRGALLKHLNEALTDPNLRTKVAVFFIDLDGFKAVNDSLGHAAGDELLVRASERIQRCLAGTDAAARLGGDEFVVVHTATTDRRALLRLAKRIGGTLAVPFRLGARQANVTASIGVALSDGDLSGAEELLHRADLAMYQAKTAGKARCAVFERAMQAHVDERVMLRNELAQAIERDQLRIQYEPIVSLSQPGRPVVGVEALVRWERPGYGRLSAGDFMFIAQEGPLVTAIDTWLVGQALRESETWRQQGRFITVNIATQSLEQPGYVDAVKAALRHDGGAADQLHIEITEAALGEQPSAARGNLHELIALGVQVSIDDFGTGYSSLNRLQDSSAHYLKIDHPLVEAVDIDSSSSAIVGVIISMAHAMGMSAVAEGVQRRGQEEVLRSLGCDLAQGWLYGAPLPNLDAFEALEGPSASERPELRRVR